MQLTLRTDYALRALIYLGARPGRLCRIAEIAESFDVPRTHLMKVVNDLGARGYVQTVRGRGGGLRLAQDPAQIRIGALVRELEQGLAIIGCLAEAHFCRIESCCVLRRALREGMDAFVRTLDGYTLADLLVPRVSLLRQLSMAAS
jgi:Rrf2 family nitric oxide-sensitive transcriptional repressor